MAPSHTAINILIELSVFKRRPTNCNHVVLAPSYNTRDILTELCVHNLRVQGNMTNIFFTTNILNVLSVIKSLLNIPNNAVLTLGNV